MSTLYNILAVSVSQYSDNPTETVFIENFCIQCRTADQLSVPKEPDKLQENKEVKGHHLEQLEDVFVFIFT